MKYWIRDQRPVLSVLIQDLQGDEKAVLNALHECADGHCRCQTAEFDKLASMQVSTGEDGVTVRFKPKRGLTLDRAEIEKCLEETLGNPEAGGNGARRTARPR